MVPPKDETGNRYGRLLVLERAGSIRGHAAWLCRCDCGEITVVRGGHLRAGQTKSCGCLVRDARLGLPAHTQLPEGEAAFRATYRDMIRHAEERELKWELTIEQVREITKRPCYYCGAEPSNVSEPRNCNGAYVYSGVDRIDNDKGYHVENVAPCCRQCNWAKRNLSQEEFLEWVQEVYQHSVVLVAATGC